MAVLIAQALCSLQPVSLQYHNYKPLLCEESLKDLLFCCLKDTSIHMHSAYMQNWIHAYFVASSIILQETTPLSPYTITKKNLISICKRRLSFTPQFKTLSLIYNQSFFHVLFSYHSFTIILVVSLMYPPSSSSSTPKACCHLALMCFPCSAGSRNICTHCGEHGCWRPQVNGSLDQAPRFVDFLCTQVKAVSG